MDGKEAGKISKIGYTLNILPSLGYFNLKTIDITGKAKFTKTKTDVNLLQLCAESDELSMFEAKPL
jgi:hypothetical protein